MTKIADPVSEQIARARRLYDAGKPLTAVAHVLGFSTDTLRRRAPAWGWPPRDAGLKPIKADMKADKADTHVLARRVETAVRHELAAIERRLGASTAASAERNARILASLVKSLGELRKLDREDAEARRQVAETESEADAETKAPRDLARLRAELAEDLERMRAARGTQRAAGEDERG